MTDLLELAAAELRSSFGSEGPSVSELRARGQRRRRRQLAGGLMVVGLTTAAAALAARPSDSDLVSVSARQPDAESESEVPVTSAADLGSSEAQAECVPMPNLVGMEEVPAIVVLNTVGSGWRQGERQDEGPAGVVIDQSPAPGSSVCPETQIKITLSIPPYMVQPGDTYASIAAANAVDVDVLVAVNGRTLETPLVAGERLVIPGRDTPPESATETSAAFATVPTSTSVAVEVGECLARYVVQEGDYLLAIATRFGATVDEIVRANPGFDFYGFDPDDPTAKSPGRFWQPGDVLAVPYASVRSDGSKLVCDVNGVPVE